MSISKHLASTALTLTSTLALLTTAPCAVAVPLGTTATYSLDVAQVNAMLPGSFFGTVTLTQRQDAVAVNVSLADGFLFANTGVGGQFAFNLNSAFSNAVISLDSATAANFVMHSDGPYNLTPYGVFTDVLVFKNSTKRGLSAGIGMPLNFSVAQAGISLDAFVLSGARNNGQPGGFSFAADIGYQLTGKTGGVGAVDSEIEGPVPPAPAPVPEPASLSLLGLGLGLAGAVLARRRR